MTKSRGDLATLREVIANQRALGWRLNWLLLVPFVVTVIMAFMFFTLNARLKDVELGAKLVTIERFLMADKNYAWAVDQYEDLAKSNPSAAILARLGILYFLLDPNANEAKAIQTLEKAKELDDNNWEIYRSLTYIYTTKRRTKEAIKAGERAIELNKLDANSLNNLAWIYATCESQYNDLTKALAYAQKAVALTEQRNPDFLDTMAQVREKRGEHEQAREALLLAIAIAPNDQQKILKVKYKDLFKESLAESDSLVESKEARR